MKRKAPPVYFFPHTSLTVCPYRCPSICPSVRVLFICLGSLLLDLQKADENPSNEFHNLCKCDAADLQLDYAVLLDYYRHTSDLHNLQNHLQYVEAKRWLMLKIHDVSIRELPESHKIKLIQYFFSRNSFICEFFLLPPRNIFSFPLCFAPEHKLSRGQNWKTEKSHEN